MTFASEETSREDGSPVELYTFDEGGTVFRYTTGERSLTLLGLVYTPTFIRRGEIIVGPESRNQSLELTVKSNNEFAAKYIGIQPSRKTTVTIERFHRFDSDNPDERIQQFKGQVKGVGFDEDGFVAKILVTPLNGSQGLTIPLFTFQSLCNNVLYDASCQVVESSFRFQGTVSAVSTDGLTLTVPGLDAANAPPFNSGGRVVIPSTSDPRLILTHSATDQIKILLPFQNSPLNQSVDVFAGCAHTIAVCKSKFDNVENFAGSAFVPTRNPFAAGLN